MRILAIESSCDETAAAVVEDGRRALSNIIDSQVETHALYGGVVPEIASRGHMQAVARVAEAALREAECGREDIDAVAATCAPGLIGAVLVGANFGKALALGLGKPFIPVHHIRGHIAANYLAFLELEPPFLTLVASGGHSLLVMVRGYTDFEILGGTRDDAAGEAFDKVAMGPAKKSKVVTESEKRLTAYHEAGHAILAKLCENCDPVHEVTIIPRGNAGGFTMMRPESDRAYYSKKYIYDEICMSLGGRVAEELVIHDISSGAMGDIRSATKFARAMVTEFGMSDKLGLISYSNDSQPVFLGKDMATHNAYSEDTAKMIDDEVRGIISEQHERARKLLSDNRSILDNMARVLIERETIYTEEVEMLMDGKSYAEVFAYMDEQEKVEEKNRFKRFESDSSEKAETEPAAESNVTLGEGGGEKKSDADGKDGEGDKKE